ncbi:MAG: hypothetical protein WC976_05965 [Caldisericia bacterium]
MSKFVNEGRLLKQVHYFFEDPSTVIVELAQNAKRSKATNLDLTLKDNVLTATDNGVGLTDPKPMFVLADIGWDKNTEANEVPAGWGLFFLYAISEKVTFKSRFGSISVDCKKFLEDEAYRKNLLSTVNKKNRVNGFVVTAVLKKDMAVKLSGRYNDSDISFLLGYFPLHIKYNGKDVKCPVKGYLKYPIKTKYQGNDVWIDTGSNLSDVHELKDHLLVIFHGIMINPASLCGPYVVIEITQGHPLTPVLPYRHSIQSDKNLEQFYSFVRDAAAKYCVEFINKTENTPETFESIKDAFKTLTSIATQEELNSLNKFLVDKTEPHYYEDTCGSKSEEIIVKKGEELISESVKVFLKKENGKNFRQIKADTIILPEGTCVTIEPGNRFPAWLNVREKTVSIYIKETEEHLNGGYFVWQNAAIRCDEHPIAALYVRTDWYEGSLYYVKPEDTNDIMNAIFCGVLFDEDGDSYDTQEYEFNKATDRELQSLNKEINVSKVFGTLSDITKIPVSEITNITIGEKNISITSSTKGVQTFATV